MKKDSCYYCQGIVYQILRRVVMGRITEKWIMKRLVFLLFVSIVSLGLSAQTADEQLNIDFGWASLKVPPLSFRSSSPPPDYKVRRYAPDYRPYDCWLGGVFINRDGYIVCAKLSSPSDDDLTPEDGIDFIEREFCSGASMKWEKSANANESKGKGKRTEQGGIDGKMVWRTYNIEAYARKVGKDVYVMSIALDESLSDEKSKKYIDIIYKGWQPRPQFTNKKQ